MERQEHEKSGYFQTAPRILKNDLKWSLYLPHVSGYYDFMLVVCVSIHIFVVCFFLVSR